MGKMKNNIFIFLSIVIISEFFNVILCYHFDTQVEISYNTILCYNFIGFLNCVLFINKI